MYPGTKPMLRTLALLKFNHLMMIKIARKTTFIPKANHIAIHWLKCYKSGKNQVTKL